LTILINILNNMEDICSICLISPIPPLNVCITNCNHRYCKTCLETWQNRNNTDCPICRATITYYMYNNNQIRPLFRYINEIPQPNTPPINETIMKLRRTLYIVTSISFTSVTFLLFMYLTEITNYSNKHNDCD